MRMRFILSETGANLRRNLSMLLSLMLVTFISFLFIGASVLTQAQIDHRTPPHGVSSTTSIHFIMRS